MRGMPIGGLAVAVGCLTANPAFGHRPIGHNLPISNRQSTLSTIDRLVAMVGSEPIFLSDVREVVRLRLLDPAGPLAPLAEEPGASEDTRALMRLINRRLVLAEVARYSQAPPPEADVERRMKAWEGRFTTVPPHDAALVRAFLIDSLRIDRYIDQRFTAAAQPTREEARARYTGAAPFESVEGEVRRRLAEERRLAMVRDWLKGLRERAVVRVVH